MTTGISYVASMATLALPAKSLLDRLAGNLDSAADQLPEVVELPAWIDPSFLRAAAVVAIALPYGGVLAKVFSELLDEAPPESGTALEAIGATRLQAFLLGVVPDRLSRGPHLIPPDRIPPERFCFSFRFSILVLDSRFSR